MWVFLNNAFVSAVEYRDDPSLLVVRARVEGDLERFFSHWTVKPEVDRTEDADYLFRMVVSKDEFAEAVAQHVHNIDYDNFKDSIADSDDDRHDAYMGVWTVMMRLQDKLHGVGKYVFGKFSRLG
jgi:hypothetical protein